MTTESVSNLSAGDHVKPRSKASSEEAVQGYIEEAILDQRLTPGTKLKEVHLAELFGVKRGLIRKVLARLAHAKLVDRQPNRAATVASPSVKEGQDLFAARRTIERGIIEALVGNISPAQIKRLKSILRKEQKAYAVKDTKLALAYSVDFHRTLASMAANTVLEGYLNDILTRTPLVILAHLGSQSDNNCANHEHSDIVDAITASDVEKAVAIMDEHLLHIENRLNLKDDVPKSDLSQIFFNECTDDE